MPKNFWRKSQFFIKLRNKGKLGLSDALRWLLVILGCLAFSGGSNLDLPLVAQVEVVIIDLF